MSFSSKLIRTSVLSAALSALCVVSASAASLGIGTVSADALRLRKGANTSSAILATAAKGDNVVVLEDAGNGWYKVDFQTVEGYMSASYLTVAQTADV
ncbi:MAG: SH3 domain-containing protein, partial [Clostridiales bacterium]|nr:SH3 domain-containing protein [Clostridiales bacterium]